ncbi:hypothetical protein HGB25_02250 [Candidatus Saccharibacteria bacterium]|nr:hypothetical protein [Candidatus Saccharibacteria bacterium]
MEKEKIQSFAKGLGECEFVVDEDASVELATFNDGEALVKLSRVVLAVSNREYGVIGASVTGPCTERDRVINEISEVYGEPIDLQWKPGVLDEADVAGWSFVNNI